VLLLNSLHEKETLLRLFNTRKRKGCFREEQDTQIKIYTIPMNNGFDLRTIVPLGSTQ
jgi:hypothetical protein